MKGEGIVFSKKGKSFDPARIPKAIHDAGFTVTEVTVAAVGAVERADGGLRLSVPGLNHSFRLSGGAKLDALANSANVSGQSVQIKGKLGNEKEDPALTVENFQEMPSGK